VSNFRIADLDHVIDATGEAPAVNQIELHPGFPQAELRAYHQAHGIATEAWSPLARNSSGELFNDPTIQAIAFRHGRTPAQVVLRWHVQLGNVVIPKSATPARIAENFEIFGFALDDDEMAQITGMRQPGRLGPDPATFE
jgi:2,5-diketo-D-gluconate reductase A